jgi:hypothetical protein
MNDHAYDISYILEADLIDAGALIARTEKAPPAPSGVPTLAAAQEAMARELMQASDTHEAMIQQYLGICSSASNGNAYG